ARQRHERIGALEHDLLAVVHAVRDHDLGGAAKGVLLDAEEFRNDAGDLAAACLHGAGERTHHAGRAAAIDEPDTGLREDLAESRGRRHVGRVRSGAGAAIDANLANLNHGGMWQVGSATVKAPSLVPRTRSSHYIAAGT